MATKKRKNQGGYSDFTFGEAKTRKMEGETSR
jgi:hypothetical protein